VLQTVDLATGAGLDDTAAAQAAAEGIIGREAAVAARARAALTTVTVREAVEHGFRREMYVAAPVDGTTLEGYVDLVYRRPAGSVPERETGGLVVVDYKTDAWSDDADLDAKVARYRLQGASYAVALELATGEHVAECVFVFLGEREARERSVSDLRPAMAEVRALLAASVGGATTPAPRRSDP
jgi:ATP-dependent exoDNAse (exonuclease V) beta subunit